MAVIHGSLRTIGALGLLGVFVIGAIHAPSVVAQDQSRASRPAIAAASTAQGLRPPATPLDTPVRIGQPAGTVPDKYALAAALQQTFGRRGPTGRRMDQWQAAAQPPKPQALPPRQAGFVVRLTNGRSLHVMQVEEKGESVKVTQARGTYELPKTLIASIEPRIIDPAVTPTGPGLR